MMNQFTRADEVWELHPTLDDLQRGAVYAKISLPWTFNRMMLNTGASGQKNRGINIAKGIVAQEVLGRHLRGHGIEAKSQRKSHRNDDLFDFQVTINSKTWDMDLKTFHHFTNYGEVGRDDLSKNLIAECREYAGPDWRRFFPMMVPHTQIKQSKELFCFAIASSADIRRDVLTNRDDYCIVAYPYGAWLGFLSSARLGEAREKIGQGIHLQLQFNANNMFTNDLLVTVVGEWNGDRKEVTCVLSSDSRPVKVGPFSYVSAFELSRESYIEFQTGQIVVNVTQNDFLEPIRSATKVNLNTVPESVFILDKDSFTNLIMPRDFVLYFIGWTDKSKFLTDVKRFPAWIWPDDKLNKFENQPWNRITERDRKAIESAGFASSLTKDHFNSGWLKTHGRGGGACCYVFPNIARNGGVKEHNLYVLPHNLYTMGSLLS